MSSTPPTRDRRRAHLLSAAGKANVKVKLGVIPVKGGPATWIPWDIEKHPYLVRVEWKDRAPSPSV